MITYGGERVTLTTGAPSVHTIGVSLGRVPRFCGHTKHWYPVLCHCIVVARMLPWDKAIYGFGHDLQESLFADVPTPMKTQVARNREERVLERIYQANDIALPDEETQDLVHEADRIVLIAEAHILGHPGAEEQWGPDYDKEAARLTRQQLVKARDYLDADVAGAACVRYFRKFAHAAGFSPSA